MPRLSNYCVTYALYFSLITMSGKSKLGVCGHPIDYEDSHLHCFTCLGRLHDMPNCTSCGRLRPVSMAQRLLRSQLWALKEDVSPPPSGKSKTWYQKEFDALNVDLPEIDVGPVPGDSFKDDGGNSRRVKGGHSTKTKNKDGSKQRCPSKDARHGVCPRGGLQVCPRGGPGFRGKPI